MYEHFTSIKKTANYVYVMKLNLGCIVQICVAKKSAQEANRYLQAVLLKTISGTVLFSKLLHHLQYAQTDINAARVWLTSMAEGAAALNVTIQ